MKKDYIVKQNDIRDCGICCLESIIKYYHGYVPLETLRIDTRTDNNGTTAYNLIKTAKKYGFSAIGKKINSLNENIILPAIAHIVTAKGLNHFVVIYKITNKEVLLMDPAYGYKKVSKSNFLNEWTNVILLFKPFKRIPLYIVKNSLKELFITIILKEKKLLLKILSTNIAITILSIIISYYFKIITNSLENNYLNTTLFIMFIFLIINIIKLFYDYIRNELAIYLNKNINLQIIPDFIKHIFNLPLDVIKSRTTGEIITRVGELYNIKELFTEIFLTIILDLFLCLGSIFFLNYLSKDLFLILCIISILYIIIGIITSPLIQKKINNNIDLETEFNSYLSEQIASIESMNNLNVIDYYEDKLEDKYVSYEFDTFKYTKLLNVITSIKNIINELGLFTITSYGIYLICYNKLTILELITFNSLLTYFINPIENVIDLLPKYHLIKMSFNKIKEFLNIEEINLGKVEAFTNGDIVFKNISYSYDDYHKIFNNINGTIKLKSHVLLKGPSGSGKSTLCQMLNKNIERYSGVIKINNVNIKDYSLATLRKNVLYVSQREKIFTDTIKNNITLNKYCSMDELNKVLSITKVDEIINNKEMRLETLLYDGGFNLSGGERQRIVLARAILKKPKILILDESLSEIDKTKETEILSSIDKYLENTTLIYISHTENDYFKSVIEMQDLYV